MSNLPKNSYEYVRRVHSESEAEQMVSDLKAQGFSAKFTVVREKVRASMKNRVPRHLHTRVSYNVWKREK